MTEPVLIIDNLSVVLSRDGRANRVLDGVSFSAAPGEIIALVGESGSGKSTIGLALQGLLPRESQPQVSGSIRLAGVEIVDARDSQLRAARRHLVRAISQDPMGALNPTMTVRRQMAESTGSDDKILDWLARTGLPDPQRIAESFPHRLSGGQRQRVLIAMSMMAGPKLLIADEPTTALDVTIQAQILDLLRDLAREQQTAILFVTHDLSVAAALADRVLVLYAGRVAEIGNVRDVIRAPAHPYSAGLLAARFDFSSDRLRPLPTLPVERTRPVSIETACAYAHRCPLAADDCRSQRPQLMAVGTRPGEVACFHAAETQTLVRESVATAPWPGHDIQKSGVALELFKVSKSFATGPRTLWGGRQPRPVLKSVDLSIRQGECVALVGESGSGKSTILRIAAGLLKPDSGDVSRVDRIAPQVVFQDAVSALTPWLTIGEQIGERLRPSGLSAAARREMVAEALDLVGLDPALMHALPAELSGGQCQRAVVARAVVVPPKLLLCDEPISAMDVSLAATTLNLLGDLRRRLGMAMLFVTHDLAAARIIADRIAVLQHGELVEDGDPDTLIAAPRAAYTRSLIAAMPHLQTELSS
ncbi:oligopeptide/dipeptide ABC transporter ATP-binding protein [Devosia sp.]|uniref:oligopeptide/dipeptide ABC transporter ATP-binding protein n=1 Tax=Devosia sp. TaxID=1871048 RepID=UPI003BABDE1D